MWKKRRFLLLRPSHLRGLDASADRHTTAVAQRVAERPGTVVLRQATRTDTGRKTQSPVRDPT